MRSMHWHMKKLAATVKLQRDPGTGDLVLPIPDDWLCVLDWHAGDKLLWRKHANGGWELTNRSKAERDERAELNNSET